MLYLLDNSNVSRTEACRAVAEIAKLNSKDEQALYHRVARAQEEKEPVARTLSLTNEQEQFLVRLILAFDALANPLRPVDVIEMARILTEDKFHPTTGWEKSFRKRHSKDLKRRQGKQSHKKKTLMASFPAVAAWVEETDRDTHRRNAQAAFTFNIDETKALPSSKVSFYIANANTFETHIHNIRDETLYTLVSCVAADGKVLFSLYLLKQTGATEGLNQSVYVPRLAEERSTRNRHKYPVYVAVAPKGYMNTELWQATMKIFREQVQIKAGYKRNPESVLFLDGCSSHSKAWTMEYLEEFNCKAIYFPSNTSHILQPLDGQAFANYKNQARKLQADTSLGASVGALDEKQMSLYNSLKAVELALTVSVILASFASRGIFPWDPVKALANARSATPFDSMLPADQHTCELFMARVVVNELCEHFKSAPKLDRKQVQDVNKPHRIETLSDWKRRSPAKKAKLAEPKPKKSASIEMEEPEEPERMDVDQIEEEIRPVAPALQRAPSAIGCSACKHQRSRGKVPNVCTYCESFWLCSECQADPKILGEHMKTHDEDLGHKPRRTRKTLNYAHLDA